MKVMMLSILIIAILYFVLPSSILKFIAIFCLGWCIGGFSQFLVSWYDRRQRNDSVN